MADSGRKARGALSSAESTAKDNAHVASSVALTHRIFTFVAPYRLPPLSLPLPFVPTLGGLMTEFFGRRKKHSSLKISRVDGSGSSSAQNRERSSISTMTPDYADLAEIIKFT